MSATLTTPIDLPQIIADAETADLLDSTRLKNELIVALVNQTNVTFQINHWRDVKSGVKQGSVTGAGYHQTASGELEQLPNPNHVSKHSNWLLFGQRDHSANAKVFLNLIPTWVPGTKPTAASLYGASHHGGNAYAEYRDSGYRVADDPRNLTGFTKVKPPHEGTFIVESGVWGTGQDVQFTVQPTDGSDDAPAVALITITNYDPT